MFGSLFDEDENNESVYEAVKNDKAAGKSNKIILTVPPPPRPYTKMCGIKNQGATCYLNSLLQTLLFTPEFRDGLFSLSREELGWVDSSNDKPNDKKLRVIPVELQKLFSQLLLADVEAVSTSDLTESFGWVDNEELQQHDVQELNRILFSAIEKSLVGTSGRDLISRLYRGTVVNQVECLECGHISEREEGFFDLTISVSGHSSLESSLKSSFLIPEKMDGNNRYHCSFCDRLVDANKGTKLRRLPPVLTLSLLRFSYNPMKGERYKDTSKFSFPTRLDLSQFCDSSGIEEKDVSNNRYVYQLLSVVVHKGSAHGGHYHAYVRDVGNLGCWNQSSSHQEEKSIQAADKKEKEPPIMLDVFANTNGGEASKEDDIPVPAALLRDILRRENCIAPTGTMNLVDLCSKLSDLSGSSWRETFQKEFGRLSRFLTLHPSIFYFNQVLRTVGLQPSGFKPLVPPQAHRDSHGTDAFKGAHRRKKRKKKKGKVVRKRQGFKGGSGKRVSSGARMCGKSEGGGECGDEEEDEEESLDCNEDDVGSSSDNEEVVVEGNHWFNFDDASVTPIPVSALEAQFSGRESAYMLFYRREGMPSVRKWEKGKKPSVVPEHLAKLVEEKNLQLKKEREEYEKALHELSIRVLPSSAFIVRNGGLQKRSGSEICEEIRISADRRWTIKRLKQEIFKVCEEMSIWEEDFKCLHTCQDTPCGLHLNEPLLESDKSIKDVLDGNDARVFAWNGVDVGGDPYHAGPENEPILLRILLPPVGGVSHEITYGFSKSSPLSHVRTVIAELCQLPPLTLYLSYEPPFEPKPTSYHYQRRKAIGCDEDPAKKQRSSPSKSPKDEDDGEGFIVKPIRLTMASNDQSLDALSITAGGRIIVNTKNPHGNTSPEGNTCLVVWVEDWSQMGRKTGSKGLSNDSNNSKVRREGHSVVEWGLEGRVVRIEVAAETSVSQLKDLAIKQLELPQGYYRLRKQEDDTFNGGDDSVLSKKIGLKCPLQEHLVLNEAGILSGSKLVLEEGKPVEENEIWLTFSSPPTGESPRDYEIIVDKKCSIRELLRNMLSLAHLFGEEWHIRKTKWNGDLGDPLDDFSATVCEESLSHGQHLSLCEKSIPHRGFIRIHLFLCSHQNNSNRSQTMSVPLIQINGRNHGSDEFLYESSQNKKPSSVNNIVNGLNKGKWVAEQLDKPLALETTGYRLENLGCLEIDQELSLYHLKETIIDSCPKISSLNLTSPKFIRLRLLKKTDNSSRISSSNVELMRFSRILRNNWSYCSAKNLHPEKSSDCNQLTLSSLQVHTGTILGVQILSSEEELAPYEVVLELCQLVPGSKDYFPSVELIWNNSSSVTSEKCPNSSSSQSNQMLNNGNSINSCKDNGEVEVKSNSLSSESSDRQSEQSSPSTSHPTSPEETADTSPLLGLKKAIGLKLGLLPDKIILAKYLSSKREWFVFQDVHGLQDGTSNEKSMPRTRRKGLTENAFRIRGTRNCLANLADGDVIGVKDLTKLKEEDDVNDFSFSEECESSSNGKFANGREKGSGINENYHGVEWKETSRKVERGIHIKVVDYS